MSTHDSSTQTPSNSTLPDEEVKFWVMCVRNSNNGKVDWAEVAKECNIVSPAAAAKRYQRSVRAVNLGKTATVNRRARLRKQAIEAKTQSEKADSGFAAALNKKRKMAEADTSANEHEHQDSASTPTKKQAIKEESHVKSAFQEEAANIPQSDGAYDMVPMVKGGKALFSAVKTVPDVYDLDAIYDTIVVAANENAHRFPGRVLHHSKHL
ncbi:MAG: hypothetical protein Q9193_005383 [Seirophora villosa]